jgi:hypothetical protein
VLCRLHLQTSLKLSSWVAADFRVLDWPARVLVINTAFNTCRVTVYVPYSVLNRVFPVRALQKFCLLPSATLTMDDHCSLSPTEAGVYPGTSSMSQSTLNICFSCASASGNCPISGWYSELTSYGSPFKMTEIPSPGCQLSFALCTHSCLSINFQLNNILSPNSPNPTFFSRLHYTMF